MNKKLVGWKQIGGYFIIHPKTARRWHADFKMPIYKVGGTIMATTKELDRWYKKFKLNFEIKADRKD